MPQTTTPPDTRTTPDTSSGDHDLYAHVVSKKDMARSYVQGTPITALCGKTWVPSRDPEKFPMCPTCIEAKQRLLLPV